MGRHWATVTVTDSGGRRHSVDVYACSTYGAAHLFVARARGNSESGLPSLGSETQFKVSVAGRIHYVQGAALQRWILKEHQRKGPYKKKTIQVWLEGYHCVGMPDAFCGDTGTSTHRITERDIIFEPTGANHRQ